MIRDTSQSEGSTGGPSTAGSRGLWSGLAEARTSEDYCRGWLEIESQAIEGMSAGVVVLEAAGGRFAPSASWPPSRSVNDQLKQAIERALKERKAFVFKEGGRAGAAGGALRVGYPLHIADRLRGAVALHISGAGDQEMPAVLRQLHVSCALLEGLLAKIVEPRASKANGASTLDLRQSLERCKWMLGLVATTLQHSRFQQSSIAFVNELGTRLECDRVSLGFVKVNRVQLKALSHSAQFGKKTNLVRAIEAAMDETLDQRSTIVYPQPAQGGGEDFRITRAHRDLAGGSTSASICSVPIEVDGRVIAVLTLERSKEKPFDSDAVETCETAVAVAGPILELKRRDDRWLVAHARDRCSAGMRALFGPRRPLLKLVGATLAVLLVFLCVARTDFKISAKTVLEGSIQRAAVAPFNGYISAAPARAGDIVKEGDVLCVFEDHELELEHVKWQSEHEQAIKQYHQAMAQHNPAQVKITSAKVKEAKAQMDLIEDRLSRMKLQAPLDGIVVSGDLSQSIGAPVDRGDLLFEIAPLDSYRVILEVDERDVGYVEVGQKGELLLSSLPTERLPFVVQQVTPVSVTSEGRNHFRVEAELAQTPPRLRPGMEGVGKVDIDRRHLAWVWTRPAIDWLRLKLWSWTP